MNEQVNETEFMGSMCEIGKCAEPTENLQMLMQLANLLLQLSRYSLTLLI